MSKLEVDEVINVLKSLTREEDQQQRLAITDQVDASDQQSFLRTIASHVPQAVLSCHLERIEELLNMVVEEGESGNVIDLLKNTLEPEMENIGGLLDSNGVERFEQDALAVVVGSAVMGLARTVKRPVVE